MFTFWGGQRVVDGDDVVGAGGLDAEEGFIKAEGLE